MVYSLYWRQIFMKYKANKQGRSHAFKTGGAQAAKIILHPFHLKKWRGPTLLLLQSEPKTTALQFFWNLLGKKVSSSFDVFPSILSWFYLNKTKLERET